MPEPLANVSLARFTTLGVGGPARYLAQARDGRAVEQWVGWAHERGLPWLVLGSGSNVVVADSGYDGLVIRARSVRQPHLWSSHYDASEGTIRVTVDSTLGLAALAQIASESGFSGLEWAVGIPGTLGGALAGNAGAFGESMADVVESATMLEAGVRRQVATDALDLSYRRCGYLAHGDKVALSLDVRLAEDDADACLGRAADFGERRRASQPGGRSAGSVFRNPPDAHAGELIDQCGLMGARVGGAVISRKHANFIINRGGASASDVLSLIRLARRAVQDRFGVSLEPEVRLVGDIRWEES